MTIENKLAADIYVHLHPFMDHGNSVRFLTDAPGVQAESQPDICFTFKGGTAEFRIEVKVTRPQGSFTATKNQVLTWVPLNAVDVPDVWVAQNEKTKKYGIWLHSAMRTALQAATGTAGPNRTVQAPATTPIPTMNQLILEILQHAKAMGKLV